MLDQEVTAELNRRGFLAASGAAMLVGPALLAGQQTAEADLPDEDPSYVVIKDRKLTARQLARECRDPQKLYIVQRCHVVGDEILILGHGSFLYQCTSMNSNIHALMEGKELQARPVIKSRSTIRQKLRLPRIAVFHTIFTGAFVNLRVSKNLRQQIAPNGIEYIGYAGLSSHVLGAGASPCTKP